MEHSNYKHRTPFMLLTISVDKYKLEQFFDVQVSILPKVFFLTLTCCQGRHSTLWYKDRVLLNWEKSSTLLLNLEKFNTHNAYYPLQQNKSRTHLIMKAIYYLKFQCSKLT